MLERWEGSGVLSAPWSLFAVDTRHCQLRVLSVVLVLGEEAARILEVEVGVLML